MAQKIVVGHIISSLQKKTIKNLKKLPSYLKKKTYFQIKLTNQNDLGKKPLGEIFRQTLILELVFHRSWHSL